MKPIKQKFSSFILGAERPVLMRHFATSRNSFYNPITGYIYIEYNLHLIIEKQYYSTNSHSFNYLHRFFESYLRHMFKNVNESLLKNI